MPDPIRHVRAFLQPMLDARHIQPQLDLRAARHRVEEADALEARAALAFAAIGYHHVIERRLLAAPSSQSDRHHLASTLQCPAANCNEFGGLRATKNEPPTSEGDPGASAGGPSPAAAGPPYPA